MTELRRLRMSRVDRLWRGSTVITAAGPVHVPTREQAVAALVAIGSVGPDARVGLRFDPHSDTHWRYGTDDLPAYADACVTQLEPGADDDMDALLSQLSDTYPTDRPLRILLADHHVFAVVSHALGDSRLALAVPGAVAAHARTGELPAWASIEVDANPMRSALRHTFPDRDAVRRMMTERRTARVAHPAALPGELRPFEPRPVAVSEVGAPGDHRALRVWMRRNAPGTGHFAAVLAVTHRALVEHGIDCAPSVHMVYDLRRYLPRGHRTTGNFVGGIDLPLPTDDPKALTDAVTAAAKVGRPLAATAAAMLTSGLLRRSDDPPVTVPSAPRAQLALSYVGPRDAGDDVPWSSDPDERMYWSRVDPAGPTAITLLVAVVGTRLQLSASFHASVFDPVAVRAALRAAQDDPIGLIERAVAGTAV